MYEHEAGYCEDEDEFGVPYAPARPVWSDLDGSHYDGIVHSNGAQSIRYPDYQNVSHNLAILESLQFLLSTVQNMSSKVESAQTFLEEEQYLDAAYGAIPQVDGHCVCLTGSCDPDTVFAQAESVVNDLVDVHNIEQLLTDYLTQKVDATITDLTDLLTYFEDLIDPSGGLATTLEQAIYDAIEDEIAAAEANMIGPVADACDPTTWGNPAELADAIEAAVVQAVNDLEADLSDDFNTVRAAVLLAIVTPGAVLTQLKADIEIIKSYFEGVDSFADLVNMDWAKLVSTLEDMVPFYEGVANNVQAAIDDVTGVWEDLGNYVTRVENLGDEIQTLVLDELEAFGGDAEACHDALVDAASYLVGYSPTDFVDGLADALEAIIEGVWNDARARVEATWQSIEDRITGIGLEDGLALWDIYIGDARSIIASALEDCYMRGTRPECYDLCNASAGDDFIWMPVDFLQDPEALAAGAASGALFALEQTGWLDDIREWVQTQMESDLGGAFSAVLGFLGDFAAAIQKVIEFLGDAFDYVDLFTEGYHLGAYSDLRPDLHMCVAYYGHGAYAQMGALGGDTFSIGARYSSHNLSERHRVQFRSGGFAVSAFGYDLSLAPGIEFNTQMDGWRLWDQTRPFGIPMNATIDPATVARLDVFNVVPMDRYPFGFATGVPMAAQPVPVGSFLVRDLYPSRPAPFGTPQWPRPTVDAPWEGSSVAVMSLGLNLEFTWPSDGPEYFELPAIPIIPGILVVIPSFGIQLGVGWVHETSLMLDRVQEMVNQNIPPAMHLDSDDFGRDMHAMQAPDLTADNQTFAFVEPSIAIEAFLGFKIWKIKVGAGARVALSVNIRPAGTGGVVDMNAALADALTNSNPPADAPCEPVWDWQNTYECNNTSYPESDGDYSCSPSEGVASCCMKIEIVTSEGTQGYSLCVDDWTGITAEYCEYLNIADAGIDDARDIVEGLPGFLSGLKNRLLNLIDAARAVHMESEWRADASCAQQDCGGEKFEEVFTTGGLNVQSLSECEQFGTCTLPDGSVLYDVSSADCEVGVPAGWRDVSTAEDTTCAIDADGQLICWGVEDYREINAVTTEYSQVSTNQRYVCAIRSSDSGVDCFRFVDGFVSNQVRAVPRDSRFSMIATGEAHVCGLRTDSRIECWGGSYNYATPAGVAPEDEGYQMVESGYNRSCAIDAEDRIVCFGERYGLEYLFGDERFMDVSMSFDLGVCGLSVDGEVTCAQMNPEGGFGDGTGYCNAERYGRAPRGPFETIEDQGACSVCGSRADGSVECWGETPLAPTFSGPIDFIAGYSHAFPNPGNPLRHARSLCAILRDGNLECLGANREGFPDVEATESGIFSAYTCRTTTTPELTGWTGDGCHPLQHGFPSACGCETDDNCASGETCDGGQCTTGSSSFSCMCGPGNSCPNGRTCANGACLLECTSDTDCAAGRECVAGGCAPPHGIPTTEEILWGMTNVTAPAHLISTYAMSDILATLTLSVNLYVELSFKLFGRERKWRILDWNRGWDLGSLWKGWYQPGLEALYQDECSNPSLNEPVTNRFPRSLTSNPYDNAFDATGLTAALGICPNGGVCRYGDPLPASQTSPEDYTRGNVGDVDEFLTYCLDDYPDHMENPEHSTNEGIIDGIVDTYEFGYNTALEIYARNQFCVDGVLWDEWLAGLEPTVEADGTVSDFGLLEDYDCAYDDPVTGSTYTFECGEITQNMLAIWGCLDTGASLPANLLASNFPGLVISDPVHGNIFDLDAIFTALPDNDPIYGAGASFDLNLANMIATYRDYDSGFPVPMSNVGSKWLQQVDACLSDRFDDPAESACECTEDSDCNQDGGERCFGGVCEQPLYDSPDDTDPEWVQAFCPIVYLDADIGLCCGDGIIQTSTVEGGYSEACDDGIDGSDACTPQCEVIDSAPAGACCAGDGVCYENLSPDACEAQGGSFNAGQDCLSLDYCEEDDGGGDPDPIGACCTEARCLEGLSEARCDVIGDWNEGLRCADVDFCEDTIVRFGACCADGTCYENISDAECDPRGTHYPDQSCAAIDYCADDAPTGGCCLPNGTCSEGVTEASCDMFGGFWADGTPCSGMECAGPQVGACCTATGCLDSASAERCEIAGGLWNPSESCADVNYCREELPVGACCTGDACYDDIEERTCERLRGEWSEGEACTEIDCAAADSGACCIDGACIEALPQEKCDDEGGDWNSGSSCADVDYCRELEPVGACCTGDACYEDVDARTCERLRGDWSEGRGCADIDCEAADKGACCLEGGCIEDIDQEKCEAERGDWNGGSSCEDVNYCREVVVLGACCNGRECFDEVDAQFCERVGGRFNEGAECAELECGSDLPPVGGCCLPNGLCIDALTESQCTEEGGSGWREGTECADCGCVPEIDTASPPKGCASAGGSLPLGGVWMLGLVGLAMRRRR